MVGDEVRCKIWGVVIVQFLNKCSQRYVRCVCNYKFRRKRKKENSFAFPPNPSVPIQPPQAPPFCSTKNASRVIIHSYKIAHVLVFCPEI